MSKKNRSPWQKANVTAHQSPAVAEPRVSVSSVAQSPADPAPDYSPISPAQLAANRTNAQLSTGPRSQAGLAKSAQNAVKSALTGRTVLLPSDDVEEYANFLAGFQRDLKPVGKTECELVQIIVDCFWRQRRIQALEFALYAHGHEQFQQSFQDCPEEERYSKILLQTNMTYEKQLRNYQIQETRLDRKRSKTMAELQRLQAERTEQNSDGQRGTSDDHPISDEELFAALDAGIIPPSMASRLPTAKLLLENGFVFSNATEIPVSEGSAASINPSLEAKAA